ncbi:MAG: hypothetical protein JWM76_2151 [Pseudonocardiales bacterium]|nr:hypothetical protein [Pseudonocardiales bacterium]
MRAETFALGTLSYPRHTLDRMSDETTTDTAPADTAPAETAPAETAPADTAPAETIGASSPGAANTTEKDPSEWVTGDEPMTGAQRSYLDTLAREAGEQLSADLTKAEASENIDRLQQETGRGA